jgi:hypothetical protein
LILIKNAGVGAPGKVHSDERRKAGDERHILPASVPEKQFSGLRLPYPESRSPEKYTTFAG